MWSRPTSEERTVDAQFDLDRRARAGDGAQAVRRAVEILRIVAQAQGSGATLARIARLSGLSRSTAFRLLRSLVGERLLEFDPGARAYCIGPLARELGLAARGQEELEGRWRQQLEQVRSATRMSTYVVARSDLDVVCLAMREALTAVRAVPMQVGQRLPLGVGAGSLALLASLEDAEIASVIAANQNKHGLYAEGRLTAEEMWKRVEATRENGYACSCDTVVGGVLGVGMVLPDTQGPTRMAISVSTPATGVSAADIERLAAVLSDAIYN
jgi:DNA-binding IclR family transcriptional regulator